MDKQSVPGFFRSGSKTQVMMQRFFIIALMLLSLYSCKKDDKSPLNGIVRIVYTSDLHYGASRNFRGEYVSASAVNKELIKQINTLPEKNFPVDGGVNAGKMIQTIDYLIINGDITDRQEVVPFAVQSATLSWGQFEADYFNGITLKNPNNEKAALWLACGNHDISNAIGYTKLMQPLTDASAMVNIYNFMMSPSEPRTNSTFNYMTDKISYSKNIVGVHLLFVNMWPDSAQRIWMENDLTTTSNTTPVIIFTHDQPDCEAKHFTNPNGSHDINPTDKFENILDERLKDGSTIDSETAIEQRNMVAFLKSHPNIKAYFHGNDNWNEFYVYKGPDSTINLNVFRVDSPMKGTISGLEAPDEIGDETKLSFQTIVIDGYSKTMTVRECLWNTSGATSPLVWGETSTISLK